VVAPVVGFWLFVVIEPFAAPLRSRMLKVEGELLIGRDTCAGLPLAGNLISRRYMVVRDAESGLEIEDVARMGERRAVDERAVANTTHCANSTSGRTSSSITAWRSSSTS
jgi:hypothetical protein